jgi:amidase
MAALAHGTDFGGSVRTPAAFCGTVGLRPTPGRIPSASRALGNDMLATTGILSRDVADAALMLEALAGPDARDPLSLHLPDYAAPDFSAPLRVPRLAATSDFGQALVDLAIADLFDAALAQIEAAFGPVVHAHPDCHGATETFETLRAAHIDAGYGPLLQQFGERLSPTVRWNIERGRGLSARAYLEAERQRTRLYRSFAEFFTKADILIAPATSVLAFPDTQDNVTEINGVRLANIIEYLTVTYIVSLVGYPVLSLPGGWTAEGLPMGVQLIARPGEEALLLRVAHEFEQRLGFRHRWPGLS